jgi:hypothetical protein
MVDEPPYSTPPLGMQSSADARPEFFALIEEDIRRINKFYKERVASQLREVQSFQVRLFYFICQ